MPHWNLDNPLLLHHYHIRTFMPDEDLGFFLQMHMYFSGWYATHTHLYTGEIVVCIDLCIFDPTCIIDILEKCYSYTAFTFHQGKNVFWGNEVIYFSWYEDRSETLTV